MLDKKPIFSALAAVFLTSCIPHANAQVYQSVTGDKSHLWGGVEYSSFKPDYNNPAGRLQGVGIFADYYLTHRIGAEATARFLTFDKPQNQSQKDFLLGPTVRVFQYHKWTANIAFQAGGVFIDFPYSASTAPSFRITGSYFALAPSGYVEYRLSPRFRVRGGYEYQFLPSAPGIPGFPSNGLTPSGINVGISYLIF